MAACQCGGVEICAATTKEALRLILKQEIPNFLLTLRKKYN
jgi:hypothetical protein